MNILKSVRDYLVEPRLKNVDVNSPDLIAIQRQVLQEKKMIQDVFREFYDTVISLDRKFFALSDTDQRIEIGSGSSFFKLYYPQIITSDIKKTELVDTILDAQQMDLNDESVGAFYGINCFHHFPDPDKFFREAIRTLKKGGGFILIDPYYGPFSNFFYKRVFDFEFFDKKMRGWKTLESDGPSKGANQALSYIVFIRDRKKFQSEFPDLEIVYEKRFSNYIRYLFSGGLNFKPLLPKIFIPFLNVIEILFIPLGHLFALHHILVIKKKT